MATPLPPSFLFPGPLCHRRAVIAVGALAVSFGVASGLRGMLFTVQQFRLVRRLRERLLATYLSQPVTFFDEHAVGGLTSRLNSDCQAVSRCLGLNLNVLLRNAIMLQHYGR